MTFYELSSEILRSFEHPLYYRIHRTLASATRRCRDRPKVLDVGGQLSSCTAGLRADVTITELTRSTRLQASLGLGATDETIKRVLARRSNVVAYLIDDMSHTALPEATFDIVVAVEVLEHAKKTGSFPERTEC
jgi:2-polyprenyl-3-methyl-5-hydroxy-6-metoxy-1,4-benzoquinol methylase